MACIYTYNGVTFNSKDDLLNAIAKDRAASAFQNYNGSFDDFTKESIDKFNNETSPQLSEEDRKIYEDSLQLLRNSGLDENSDPIKNLKNKLGLPLDEASYSATSVEHPLDTENIDKDDTSIDGISPYQKHQLVNHIFNALNNELGYEPGSRLDKKSFNTFIDKIKSSTVDAEIRKVDSNITALKNVEGMESAVEKLSSYRDTLQNINAQWSEVVKDVDRYVVKYTAVKSFLGDDTSYADNEEDNTEGVERNYSQAAYEVSGKKTASSILKRFLYGIQDVDRNGKYKKGFLGSNVYMPFDTVWNTISRVLVEDGSVPSDYDSIIIKLNENVSNQPFLSQVIAKLNTAPDSIKNMFVSNFTKQPVNMKFVMVSKVSPSAPYNYTVYDTNSADVLRVISSNWRNNFLNNSPLVSYTLDGKYTIDKEVASKMLAQYDRWKNNKFQGINTQEIADWMRNFGIVLSNETIQDLSSSKSLFRNRQSVIPFTSLFRESEKSEGPFGVLAQYLSDIQSVDDTEFMENKGNDPYSRIHNHLGLLSRMESRYSAQVSPTSFRDGGKTIQGTTNPTLSHDIEKDLKSSDKSLVTRLLSKPYSKNSMLLHFIDEDDSFRNNFGVDYMGITAMKQMGRKTLNNKRSISDLKGVDQELLRCGLFWDSFQGNVSSKSGDYDGVDLRMSRFMFPTLSDKSQMLILKSAALDLKDKDFNNSNGEATPNENIYNILYSQLVKPDLERIDSIIRNENSNTLSDLNNYNFTGKMFITIPELNNLRDENGNRVLTLMHQSEDCVKFFEDKYKDAAIQKVKDFIDKEVSNKLLEWKEYGITDSDKKLLSLNYLVAKHFRDEPHRKAAYDYVINNCLAQANMSMAFLGDPAQFSTGKDRKLFNNFITNPKDDSSYSKAAKILADNMTKRNAMIIAPGTKIANSKGKSYKELFIKDREGIGTDIPTIVGIHYGADAQKDAENILDKYDKADDKSKKSFTSLISSKYPMIKDYLKVDYSDGQEYTTAQEHIDILYGRGLISDENYKRISDILYNQVELEKQGKEIPENMLLTEKDLGTVFQTMKPVYTGFIDNDNLNRAVYLKSSAFPLIPQMTKNMEIDTLRKIMEKNGIPRAVYTSGAKLGAPEGIDLYDSNGSIPKDINLDADTLANNTLVLNRDNFRIQQDVPYKGEDDKGIILMSQTMKLAFGNGVNRLENFEYNGKKISGEELKQIHDNSFENLVNIRKEILMDRLGINEDGSIPDISNTYKKLQSTLIQEATARGYSEKDLKSLELSLKTDMQIGDKKISDVYLTSGDADFIEKYRNGTLPQNESNDSRLSRITNGKISREELTNSDIKTNIKDLDFNIPLWLSTNSYRYEALLNSIFTHSMIKFKMPGNPFVTASEAGFRKAFEKSSTLSRIIYTSSWNGESLHYVKGENGKLDKIQVFVPSRLRDNSGKLIKLVDEDGNINDNYVERGENGELRLKEDMVDKNLLNMTSVRIPTSSHVSMSQVDIAGFLPPECGDRIIVPGNVTIQKGIDFDVDELYTYYLNHYVDKDGKISAITEENKQDYLKQMDVATTNALKADSPEQDFIANLLGVDNVEDMDYTPEDFNLDKNLALLNKNADRKIQENNIVNTYKSVLTNPAVSPKIYSALSMEFAENQADLINGLKADKGDGFTSFVSDKYQKSKMESGSVGKAGLGIYSNAVTFNSMVQQQSRDEKPIRMMQTSFTDGKMHITNLSLKIGNATCNGILGKFETIRPSNIPDSVWDQIKRTPNDILAEKQNVAADNAKKDIMEPLGINTRTINVDSVCALFGLDKDAFEISKDEYDNNPSSTVSIGNGDNKRYFKVVSIPAFLLNQPIVKEYVDKINSGRSMFASYIPGYNDRVVDELKQKYQIPEDYSYENSRGILTGQKMYNQIVGKVDNIAQNVALDTYLILDKYANRLTSLQLRLNISSSGLGKSFFDVLNKYENIDNMRTYESKGIPISSATDLIGTYKLKEGLSSDEIEAYKKDGYVEFENNLIKPNNANSSILLHSVSYAYHALHRFFPYKEKGFQKVFDEAANIYDRQDMLDTVKVTMQEDIFKEIKKYLMSSNQLGIFSGDIQWHRRNLMLDTPEDKTNNIAAHTSLAKYLYNIMSNSNEYSSMLRENPLISRLTFNMPDNKRSLSTISFDAGGGENFDEENLYNALIQLADSNKSLPDVNGHTYNTNMLANDLIKYAFLSNPIQEAREYFKYIPVSYLNSIKFAGKIKYWNDMINTKDFASTLLGVSGDPHGYSNFIKQYVRHYPERLPKTDLDSIDHVEKVDNNIVSFNIKTGDVDKYTLLSNSPFLAIYDKKAPANKSSYMIFENKGDCFRRIGNLGTSGVMEYSINNPDVQSFFNDNYTSNNERTIVPDASKESIVDNRELASAIASGDSKEVNNKLLQVKFEDNPNLDEVSRVLKPYLDNISIPLSTEDLISENGVKFGSAVYKDGKITFDRDFLNDSNREDIAKVYLHECVHKLTKDYISKFVDKEGNPISKDTVVPREILSLTQLMHKTREALGSEYEDFTKKWKNSPLSNREAKVDYGAFDLNEFISQMMTEKDFQEATNKIKIGITNRTVFSKFIDTIKRIVGKTLGIKFEEDSVLGEGLSDILSLIDKANTPAENKSLDGLRDEAHLANLDDRLSGYAEEYSKNIPEDFDPESSIEGDGISLSATAHNKILPLSGNEDLYKKYNLLNKNGKIDVVNPNSEVTKKRVATLNLSPNYSFQVRLASDGKYRIFMKDKREAIQQDLFSSQNGLRPVDNVINSKILSGEITFTNDNLVPCK